MWQSEDNFQELFLFFPPYRVVYGDSAQVSDMAAEESHYHGKFHLPDSLAGHIHSKPLSDGNYVLMRLPETLLSL